MIAITIDSRKVQNMLNNLQINIKKAGDSIPREIAKYSAKALLDSSYDADIKPWTGGMQAKLAEQYFNPKKTGKDKYGVSLDKYAVYLDSMRQHHWVSLQKTQFPNQWLRMWAIDRFGAEGHALRKIFVRPHPFIDRAMSNIAMNINTITKSEIDKSINNSKR